MDKHTIVDSDSGPVMDACQLEDNYMHLVKGNTDKGKAVSSEQIDAFVKDAQRMQAEKEKVAEDQVMEVQETTADIELEDEEVPDPHEAALRAMSGITTTPDKKIGLALSTAS